MLGCLSADIIGSEKRAVFRERSLRKTVSPEETILFNFNNLSRMSMTLRGSNTSLTIFFEVRKM